MLSKFWTMNTAGWQIEPSTTSFISTPCDIDADLVIGTFHSDRAVATIEEQKRIAQRGAPTEPERVPVTCGDFIGYRAEFEAVEENEEVYKRVWWLFSGSGHVHLYIFYSCAPEYSGYHRGIVDWMLGTLKDITKDDSNVSGSHHQIPMPTIDTHYSDLWQMNAAGWRPDLSEDFVMFVPCEVDGALTISSAYKRAGPVSHEENIGMAQKGAPPEVERIPVTYGEFTGLRTEYVDRRDDGDFYMRVWWLFSGHVHLFITYNCAPEYSDRHRDVVDWMLGTLRDRTKDGALVNGTNH